MKWNKIERNEIRSTELVDFGIKLQRLIIKHVQQIRLMCKSTHDGKKKQKGNHIKSSRNFRATTAE